MPEDHRPAPWHLTARPAGGGGTTPAHTAALRALLDAGDRRAAAAEATGAAP
jgi:hypothetical protein